MILEILLVSVVSGLLTYWAIRKFNLDPVRASAGITVIALFILFEINVFYTLEVETLGAVFFGASFVGMSSKDKFSFDQIIMTSILFTATFIFITPFLSGVGGALGLSAFLSALSVRWAFFVSSFFKLWVKEYRYTDRSAFN